MSIHGCHCAPPSGGPSAFCDNDSVGDVSIGPIRLSSPVVLAPMAGVTNSAFRRLCREYGGGLFVSEMVTSRALVERSAESLRLISHDPDEPIRSVQLYGVDPEVVAEAVAFLVDEDLADHIDLNFGCPVPKVTRRGGGAALPWKLDLFEELVGRAVRAAGKVPVTLKMRKGIDDDHLTYLDAARIARDAGIAAMALHGRTAADFYSGHADWSAIARLREVITDIPVFGNGDIWSGADAIAMVRQTGVDGVVVGRGCLGRPWLFADLEAAFASLSIHSERSERSERSELDEQVLRPRLGAVADAFRRHAELLVDSLGSEEKACRDIRKHVAWYFKGYPVGGPVRRGLTTVRCLDEIDAWLQQIDRDAPYPGEDSEGHRGRAGSPRRPHLPNGWLESRTLTPSEAAELHVAEVGVSGG